MLVIAGVVKVVPVEATVEVVEPANHCSVEPGEPSPESNTAPVPQTEPAVVDTTEGTALTITPIGTTAEVQPVARLLALA